MAVEVIHLVLPCILFVESCLFQTRQSAKLDILCQRIIIVGQLMKLHEFLVAQCLDIDFLVTPKQQIVKKLYNIS